MPGRREHSIFKLLMMPIKSSEQLEHIFRKVIAETLFPVQTPFRCRRLRSEQTADIYRVTVG